MALSVVVDVDWRRWAACSGADPATFYPAESDVEGHETAKAFCRGCPAASGCLEFAIATREPHGIWGGLTERERRNLIRRRRNQRRRAEATAVAVHGM